MVAGTAVELAFRRYLTEQNVPFEVKGTLPFSKPDRYDVFLGGRRCAIQSFLISHRDQIRTLQADPGHLLAAQALVPLDQHVSEDTSSKDVYIFAFVAGVTADRLDDTQKAYEAGQPIYPAHCMPAPWRQPQTWIPLGSVVLKSECEAPLTLEIGGQNSTREFLTYEVVLRRGTRHQLETDLYSLAYLHANRMPQARLGIHAPTRRETYVIQPADWGNIWVYGMHIYLAGWLTHAEFRRKASLLPEGSRAYQYDRTRTKNLVVPIPELRPIRELLDHFQAPAQARDRASLQG